MKRKAAIYLGTTFAMLAAAAGPAGAADVGDGCVGSAVASVAHFTQQDLGMGVGAYFHPIDEVPGRSIKAHSDQFCSGT